jgi:hypothetical protein
MIQLRRVLLPVDFSENRACEPPSMRVDLCKRFGRAHCTSCTSSRDPVVYLPMFESYPVPDGASSSQTYAQGPLENWVLPEDAEGCQIRVRLDARGGPSSKIVEYATDCQTDSHRDGHPRPRRGWLTCCWEASREKVIRHAPCPVLTVPRPRADRSCIRELEVQASACWRHALAG